MAVAPVQGSGIQSTGSVASLSKAFTSNVTANNTIICGVISSTGTISTTGVTDNNSNSYTRNQLFAAPAYDIAHFSDLVVNGGATTVTFTPTASSFCDLGISEASGIATSAALDVTATGNATSNAPVTGNLVTTDADYIVGIVYQDGGPTAITATYTLIFEDEDTSDIPFNWQYRIPGSSGTYTMAWSLGASRAWGCAAAAYKPAAGAAVTPPRPVIVGQAVNRASSW